MINFWVRILTGPKFQKYYKWLKFSVFKVKILENCKLEFVHQGGSIDRCLIQKEFSIKKYGSGYCVGILIAHSGQKILISIYRDIQDHIAPWLLAWLLPPLYYLAVFFICWRLFDSKFPDFCTSNRFLLTSWKWREMQLLLLFCRHSCSYIFKVLRSNPSNKAPIENFLSRENFRKNLFFCIFDQSFLYPLTENIKYRGIAALLRLWHCYYHNLTK